jgi:hypothetical protein
MATARHGNVVVGNVDLDIRRGAALLAGVERVVEKLLQDDKRPVIGVVAGLVDQLLFQAKLNEPACLECEAVENWRAMKPGSTLDLFGSLGECDAL